MIEFLLYVIFGVDTSILMTVALTDNKIKATDFVLICLFWPLVLMRVALGAGIYYFLEWKEKH